MKKMPSIVLGAAVALAIALPAAARQSNVTDPDAPRSVPADGGAVNVQWTDPAKFSEIKFSGNRWESQRGDWVAQLAQYLRDRSGQQLARGQTLDVTITDIDRAGRYEPTTRVDMQNVRIVKDIYPPRITLDFTLKGADGQVLAQGERKLVDHGFLMGSNLNDHDPLRYEKRMIDDWVRREFRANTLSATP